MGRVKRGTVPRSRFAPKVNPDPPVLVQGQVWKHRLSITLSPFVRIDRIDAGERPPRVYYFRMYSQFPQRPDADVQLKLFTMSLPEFLRVYEYQPLLSGGAPVPRKRVRKPKP